MKNVERNLVLSVSLMIFAGTAVAQDLFVFPAQGQSQEKMEQDKFECYGWAKNNSGFDPMQASSASASTQQNSGGGEVIRGGARGAATGAVIGAIAGNAGKGAAIGAGSGGLLGGFKKRDNRRQNEENTQQAQQQHDAARNNYNRAYAACLDGKGYTIR